MQEEKLTLKWSMQGMDTYNVRYIYILGLIPINWNLCAVNFNDLWYESYKLLLRTNLLTNKFLANYNYMQSLYNT